MFDTQIRIGSRMLNCIHIVMWWWLSWGSDCHVVVIVMWWWFSCKIKPGNGDRCWLYRACWWLSCGGGCHVVVIVIGSGCHVVVMVIGNDCTGSGWLLTDVGLLFFFTKLKILLLYFKDCENLQQCTSLNLYIWTYGVTPHLQGSQSQPTCRCYEWSGAQI